MVVYKYQINILQLIVKVSLILIFFIIMKNVCIVALAKGDFCEAKFYSDITLVSSSAFCKQQNNGSFCTYIGNSKLKFDENTKLESNNITIHQNNNEIIKIVASGKKSHYISNKKVNAYADLIIIYLSKKLVIFDGNVQIYDGENKYYAPHIEYGLY